MNNVISSEAASQSQSRSYKLYITLTITFTALLLATCARVIFKLYKRWPFGLDDYWMILATVLNGLASGFDYTAVANGFGEHAAGLSKYQLIQARKYSQLAVLVAILAIWATKMSITFFILRLVKDIHRYFRWTTWGLMAFTTITCLITCVLWGIQARPLPALWNPAIPGDRLSPQGFVEFSYVFYAFTAITDIFYALSPIYFLWGVKIDRRRKVALLTLIGLGLLVACAAILKIAFADELDDDSDFTCTPFIPFRIQSVLYLWKEADRYYTGGEIKLYICSIVERNAGGFIANLPSLKQLFDKVTASIRSHFLSFRDTIFQYASDNDTKNTADSTQFAPQTFGRISSQESESLPLPAIQKAKTNSSLLDFNSRFYTQRSNT